MIRRAVGIVTLLAGLAAFATPAPAHLARRAQRRNVMLSVSRRVASPGTYLVVVSVRTRQHKQQVTVYVSGAATRTVRASSGRATVLNYALTLEQAPTKLVARAVSPTPGVRLAMTVRAKSSSPPPSPTPPQPAPSPPPPSSPGPQYPNPYTNLVWSDNFAGGAGSAPNSSNWNILSGRGNCGDAINTNTSSSSNVALTGNNQLAITAQQSGSSYTSAAIETNPITSFPYGAVEANIKLPPGQGLCPAFWLVGDGSNWPQGGEIDILEAPSFNSNPTIAYFDLHGPWTQPDPNGGYQSYESTTSALGDLSTSFHTYAIIWSPNQIVWTIDGVEYAQATPASLVPQGQWVFNNNQSWSIVLDLAVGGWPCAGQSSSCPSAPFPAQMLVNWVRVYH